ncbi:MAG TPA: hypothetical protein VG309_05755 [Rhizomicrobium sp.]|nr:hypothetical protein [Rhizomicrobium sp.]
MVRHQAIRPDFHVRFPDLFGKKIAIDVLIAGFEEDRLAAIAALRDVMRTIGNDDAGWRIMRRKLDARGRATMANMSEIIVYRDTCETLGNMYAVAVFPVKVPHG